MLHVEFRTVAIGLLLIELGSGAVFEFQNNFWVNLHHFLRAEARRRSIGGSLELPVSALGTDERAAWESALHAYAELAQSSLIFDERLVRIDNFLAKMEDAVVPPSEAIAASVAAALNGAAPVYRAHAWDRQRQENERWISVHLPAIQQHAAAVKKAIASAFQLMPPGGVILVDLARDTGPTLAYTTQGPSGTAGHTVIAPQKNSDPYVALDTIFHEISHTMDAQIVGEVDAEATRQRVKIPEDFWHAITLYTTGEIVKRELGRQGDPRYQPPVDRIQMFKKNGWSDLLAALDRHWQPYLSGKVPFKTALPDLVRAVAF